MLAEEGGNENRGGKARRKNVSPYTSDLLVFLSFNFLNTKSFHPGAFAYAVVSVQNGLSALLINDTFYPLEFISNRLLGENPSLATLSKERPPLLPISSLPLLHSVYHNM